MWAGSWFHERPAGVGAGVRGFSARPGPVRRFWAVGFLGYTPRHAPVAQWIRASDFGSEGRGFESLRARHSADLIQLFRVVSRNWDPSGAWDDRYPTTLVNSRTVSIEHRDNGGRTAGSGNGVVPEAVITASIALDALLLRGDLAEQKAAGIRFRWMDATRPDSGPGLPYGVGGALRAGPTIPSSYAVSRSNSSVAAYWRS